jgi:hypothetical protein
MMSLVNVISPQEAHEHVKNGTALLICAYDSDKKFDRFHLEGAISLAQFESAMATVPKDKELVFY